MTRTVSQLEDSLVEEVKANKGSFSPLFSLYGQLYEFAMKVLPKLPTESENYRRSYSTRCEVVRTRVSTIPHSKKKLHLRVNYDTESKTYTALLSDNSFDPVANTQFGDLMHAPVRYANFKSIKKELRRRLGIRAWAYICIKSI